MGVAPGHIGTTSWPHPVEGQAGPGAGAVVVHHIHPLQAAVQRLPPETHTSVTCDAAVTKQRVLVLSAS